LPSWAWEPPQVRPRRTEPEEALVRHAPVCKYSYTLSTRAGGRMTTARSRPLTPGVRLHKDHAGEDARSEHDSCGL
jgi:hypothetical protein